jgi:hypothetical protein
MPWPRSVLLIMLLLAGSLSPPGVAGQAQRSAANDEARGFSLEQNYPNPVNPETWIPFYLEESLFRSQDSVLVTVRIINVLNQAVAIAEAADHPAGRGVRLINVVYREPGRKIAYWNGKDTAGRQVPSGVYYAQLVVDDLSQTRKIVVLNPRRRRSIIPWFENSEGRP